MTLSEIMSQVVLPALATGSLSAAAGFVYAKRAPKPKRSDPPPAAHTLPPRRSEQLPDWARDTWTRERAERERAEAEAQAADIDARRDQRERVTALERANNNNRTELGRIEYRLGAIEGGMREHTAVLGTVRDAVLTMRARCPQCDDSDPTPAVVRGGAAGR